jgi:hypothetical protein
MSENIWNIVYNSPKYILPGLPAHFIGVAVEMGVITLLQNLPYAKYYKVPAAKIVHESVENFFTSSPNINMFKNGDNFKDAMYNILKPIYSSPLTLISSMLSSWFFEQLATNIFSLESCQHCVNLPKMEYCGIINDNNKKHYSWIESNLIKAVFSSIGSLVPSVILHHIDNEMQNTNNYTSPQTTGECDINEETLPAYCVDFC